MAQVLRITSTVEQVRDKPLADNQMAKQYRLYVNNQVRAVVNAPVDPAALISATVTIDPATETLPPVVQWAALDEVTPTPYMSPLSAPLTVAVPDSQAPAIPVLGQGTTTWAPPMLSLDIEAPQVLDAPGGAGEPAAEYRVYVNDTVVLTAYPSPEFAVPVTVRVPIDTSQLPPPYVVQMSARDAAGNESARSVPLVYGRPAEPEPAPEE